VDLNPAVQAMFMASKFRIKSRDEVSAEHRSLYVERDGASVLDAERVAERSKLDEFRTKDLALLKQLDDLNKKFDDIDPEQARHFEQTIGRELRLRKLSGCRPNKRVGGDFAAPGRS